MRFLDKLKKKKIIYTGNVYGEIVYQNDHIVIISDACSICYDNKKERTYEERANYIRRRINSGHESILEHSNVITKYIFKNTLINDLVEILSVCKYLNNKVIKKDNEIELMLGGSLRGYKYIIRNIENPNNKILFAIKDNMYEINSCYFQDFINDNIMNQDKFIDISEQTLFYNASDTINLINFDDLDDIERNLDLDNVDLLDFGTITIMFKGISRAISQQLTRHRVGITQLSQRYVDSSNLKFIDPTKFKQDKYDEKNQYKIKIKNTDMIFDSKELGQTLIDIYPQLLEQGFYKEDARGYLPFNASSSLYMTFTYKQLLHFLKLRTHSSAQAEIRSYANFIYNRIIKIYPEYMKYKYLDPKYLLIEKELNDINIDEILI